MKGIVLAGGTGSRLYPSTIGISKQLLPIYDKPMIYYPISVLMLAGIKDILIITTPKDSAIFKNLLGSGKQFGVKFSYAVQPKPEGIAQAFIIGENFIGKDSVALILGDNIFYGSGFSHSLKKAAKRAEAGEGGTIFGYYVKDPERFGVIEFSPDGQVISIEEKPEKPKSNFAVTGLYFYDNHAIEYAKSLKGQFVQTIEENQGIKIACPEEVAYRLGFLDKETVIKNAENFNQNEYYNYITNLR